MNENFKILIITFFIIIILATVIYILQGGFTSRDFKGQKFSCSVRTDINLTIYTNHPLLAGCETEIQETNRGEN